MSGLDDESELLLLRAYWEGKRVRYPDNGRYTGTVKAFGYSSTGAPCLRIRRDTVGPGGGYPIDFYAVRAVVEIE